METKGRFGWLVVVVVGAALALAVCGGSAAPVVLATALPLALALSSGLRNSPSFAPWIITIVPLSLGLWRLSSDRPEPLLYFFAALGAVAFLLGKGQAKPFLSVLIGLAALVAYFSSGAGGAGPMMGWYERLGLTEGQAHLLTLAFRKTVHFTFYGAVGWTAMQAARAAGAESKEAIRTGLLAALAVASFDEIRQAGYANRSGSAWDVLLDLAGATTFVGLSEWRRAKAR